MPEIDLLERIANSLERIANQFDPAGRETADPYDDSGHCIHCGAPDLVQHPLVPTPAEMPQDDEPYFVDVPAETPEEAKIREARNVYKPRTVKLREPAEVAITRVEEL